MAEQERSANESKGARTTAERREELDQLLERIATHIADVDGAVPPDAFEGGKQAPSTAASIAMDGKAATGPMGSVVPPSQVDSDPAKVAGPALASAPRDALDDEPEDVRETEPARSGPAVRRTQPGVEPPALRSALNEDRKVREAGNKAAAAPSRVAPQPVHTSPGVAISSEKPPVPARTVTGASKAPQNPPEPSDDGWDPAAAEALTRSFELDDPVPPLRSMLGLMADQGGVPGAKGKGDGVTRPIEKPTGTASSSADMDAAVRLMEAARRVEIALDRLAPKSAVEALDERFGTLERSVAQVGKDIGRLDGIESRLGVLGGQLTDEKIVELFGSLVPTAEDLTQFAEDAAERAAERVLEAYSQSTIQSTPASPVADAGSRAQIEALTALMATFMDDRRRSDAGTLEALETLQLAMQHMLDRIDQFETGGTDHHSVPSSAVAGQRPEAIATAFVEERTSFEARGLAEHQYDPIGGPVSLPRGAMPQTALDHLPPNDHEQGRPATRAPVADLAAVEPPSVSAYDFDMGPPAPMMSQSVSMNVEAVQGESAGTRGPILDAPPPLSDRQAFIAMARRAAEKANAEAGARKQAPGPASEKAVSARTAVAGAISARPVLAGGIRPGVLIVAGLAVTLLAGYWLLTGSRTGQQKAADPIAIEEVAPAEPQSKSGSQPDLDAGSAPAAKPQPDDGTKPAAKPISNDGPALSPPENQQEAGVAPPAIADAAPGMTLAFDDRPVNYEQVVQARERVRMANLSQRTARSAVRYAVPQNASEIETASLGPDQKQGEAPAGAATPASARRESQLVLPAAGTGPLSLRLAAAQGNASAQLEVATRLAEGKGVKQNFKEAALWYERSATQGQAIAQYRLATLYERGMGVKADRELSKDWYQRAAEQGNLKAMHNLAVISAGDGTGTPDYSTAAQLFSRAASHGLPDSQYNLGVLYESGLGVPKDHAAAYKWYSLAAKGGDKDAAQRRDQMILRLPSETIQAADKQIASWRPVRANDMANNVRMAGDEWKRAASVGKR
jgi:localization factor PodJL